MTKPTIFDGNTHREMTEQEQADYEQVKADAAAQAASADALAAAKVSALAKLTALGLTDDEIAALAG